MKKITTIKFLFSIILFVLFLSSCSTKVSSIKIDKDINLEKGEGYLLIEVDTKSDLHKIILKGEKNIVLTKDDLRSGSNYIFVDLPAGDYQIENIYTSYFYRFRFKDKFWKFSVKPGVISYVGSLQVSSRYWGSVASFELINNSSLALEYLEDKFPEILKSRLVEYSGPGKDRFFSHVRKTPIDDKGDK